MTIGRGIGWEAAADVAPPSGRTPPKLRWLAQSALPVVADVRENYGGAAEGHRSHWDG